MQGLFFLYIFNLFYFKNLIVAYIKTNFWKKHPFLVTPTLMKWLINLLGRASRSESENQKDIFPNILALHVLLLKFCIKNAKIKKNRMDCSIFSTLVETSLVLIIFWQQKRVHTIYRWIDKLRSNWVYRKIKSNQLKSKCVL